MNLPTRKAKVTRKGHFLGHIFYSKGPEPPLGPRGVQIAFGVSTSSHGRRGLQEGGLGGVGSGRPSMAERGGVKVSGRTLLSHVGGPVWMVGIPRGLEACGSPRGDLQGDRPPWRSRRALPQGTRLSAVSPSRTSWPWRRWRRSPSR